MNREELVQRLLRDGFADAPSANRAIDATLLAFVEGLTPAEEEAFARCFEGDLRSRARRTGDHQGDFFGAEDLYELVRKRANVPYGRAREHAQIVLRAVASAMAPELRERLTRTLAYDIADLLRTREEGAPPEHVPPSHAQPLRTLASGRPGSRHPVSEARDDRAQTHSVAREQNPHGETKLSSARGLTQERLGDSFAAGRGGAGRPVSETRDEDRKARRT